MGGTLQVARRTAVYRRTAANLQNTLSSQWYHYPVRNLSSPGRGWHTASRAANCIGVSLSESPMKIPGGGIHWRFAQRKPNENSWGERLYPVTTRAVDWFLYRRTWRDCSVKERTWRNCSVQENFSQPCEHPFFPVVPLPSEKLFPRGRWHTSSRATLQCT